MCCSEQMNINLKELDSEVREKAAQKLIENIFQNIQTDDEKLSKKGVRIFNTYSQLNDETKEIVDDLFISLTGFTLTTMIKEAIVDTVVSIIEPDNSVSAEELLHDQV